MTKILHPIAAVLALTTSLALYAQPPAPGKADRSESFQSSDPTGLWQTVDDRTHQPKGEVRLFTRDGRLFGQITRVFDSKDAASRCDDCTDERKGQKIEGLLILREMKPAHGEYEGGDILDPDTGRVYRCRLRVTDGGQHLVVRGFLGISLLGRSQTWTRVDERGAKAKAKATTP